MTVGGRLVGRGTEEVAVTAKNEKSKVGRLDGYPFQTQFDVSIPI